MIAGGPATLFRVTGQHNGLLTTLNPKGAHKMSNTTSAGQPEPGVHSKREIFSQPESWQGAVNAVEASQAKLKVFFDQHANRPVLFAGCGSPYYLELSAAAVYRALTGKWAIATPASEILFNLD